MADPDITQREIDAVTKVLVSGQLSIGEWLRDFERAFAKRVCSRYAVGVSSGTAGLHLAVLCCGIEAGELVVTTPFSFVASSNSILFENAVPLFVDVDERTGNIDPSQVAEAVRDLGRRSPSARRWLPPSMRHHSPSEISRVAGILPIHAFGVPADMDPLLETARAQDLPVIEDACEALGSEYKGRPAGSLGDLAVFGFYPNKQITTGEGGMVTTSNPEHRRLLRSLRNQGRDKFGEWLEHNRLGYNYRLDEMSAALGLVQLRRLDRLMANRDHVARSYSERLGDCEWIELPSPPAEATRISWFVYVVRIKPPASRDQVRELLESRGIETRVYFSPIHLQPFYREKFGYQPGSFPVAEKWGETALALPFFGKMSEEQVELVCRELLEAVEASASKSRPRRK